MDIKKACRIIAEKGYVSGASGNVSRRSGDFFCITASGIRLDSVEPGLTTVRCRVDADGVPPGASIETRMHRAIYQRRPDVKAVIHSNPPYSTLLACSKDVMLDTSIIPEGKLIDPVGFVEFFPAGSTELASAAGSAVADSNVILLQNHGTVVVGDSLEAALNSLEYLEFICYLTVTARIGGIRL